MKTGKLKIRLLALVASAVLLAGCGLLGAETTAPVENAPIPECISREKYEVVAAFAEDKGLPMDAWPESLLDLYERNPEAEEFVLNYPLMKDLTPEIDLTEHLNSQTVPLFLQWDERWGYKLYGEKVMGITGCGPTSLAMVCTYLLNDASYSPAYVADFALDILDVDKLGLDNNDRTLLLTLIQKFSGGPVGLETLAASIGEDSGTLEDVYEPYLLMNGLIMRTPRGRMATDLAYKHLGLDAAK